VLPFNSQVTSTNPLVPFDSIGYAVTPHFSQHLESRYTKRAQIVRAAQPDDSQTFLIGFRCLAPVLITTCDQTYPGKRHFIAKPLSTTLKRLLTLKRHAIANLETTKERQHIFRQCAQQRLSFLAFVHCYVETIKPFLKNTHTGQITNLRNHFRFLTLRHFVPTLQVRHPPECRFLRSRKISNVTKFHAKTRV